MTTAIALFIITALLLVLLAVYTLATLRADYHHQQKENDHKDAEIMRLRDRVEELQKAPMRRYSQLETELIDNQTARASKALFESRTAYELITEASKRLGMADEILIEIREASRELRQKPNGGKL